MAVTILAGLPGYVIAFGIVWLVGSAVLALIFWHFPRADDRIAGADGVRRPPMNIPLSEHIALALVCILWPIVLGAALCANLASRALERLKMNH